MIKTLLAYSRNTHKNKEYHPPPTPEDVFPGIIQNGGEPAEPAGPEQGGPTHGAELPRLEQQHLSPHPSHRPHRHEP
jgi:hypothetical protein